MVSLLIRCLPNFQAQEVHLGCNKAQYMDILFSFIFFPPQAITESSDAVWQNRREDQRKWLYKCLKPEIYLLLEFMNLEVKNIFSPYNFYVTTLLQSNVKCLEMYRSSCWHN